MVRVISFYCSKIYLACKERTSFLTKGDNSQLLYPTAITSALRRVSGLPLGHQPLRKRPLAPAPGQHLEQEDGHEAVQGHPPQVHLVSHATQRMRHLLRPRRPPPPPPQRRTTDSRCMDTQTLRLFGISAQRTRVGFWKIDFCGGVQEFRGHDGVRSW